MMERDNKTERLKDHKTKTTVLPSYRLTVMVIFSIALLLRLALIPNPGFEADVSFWKSWGLAVVDKGIVEAVKITNNNYPAPFSYVLGGMAWIYKLFADPHNFNQFWSNTNVLFLTIAKMFPILADFGIAALLLWFGKKQGLLLAALYLFNPVALIDGAWWGQVDSAGVFLLLLAVVFVIKDKPFLAGIIYIAAMMTKLQNMIYGPLFFLFVWQRLGYGGLIASIKGSTLAFVGLNIEFVLAKEMSRVFASLTENYDYFPYASLNAFNLWWVAVGAEGMKHSDKFLTIGLVNAKQLGLYLFSSVYLFAVLHLGFKRGPLALQEDLLKKFFESLILINGAFFLFMTQSHDRYAFPIIAVSLLIFSKKYLWVYILFSLLYFYNLHTALVWNYPENGIAFLTALTQKPLTMTVSVVFLLLFGIFFFRIAKTKKTITIITIIIFITGITFTNLPLIRKEPVSLTTFAPYISSQDWGSRVTNMPVNASGGSKTWTTLSDQYVFYRKGIGTHANSRIVYDVNKLFTRLETDYGIDTEAGSQGSAVFEIWGEGKRLFASEVMKRYDLPRHAEVDITGVKNLELVTRDGGNGNTDDHTDWLAPTLWE